MSWNDDLVANVNDELFWDPRVDNEAIAVTADEGAVTLRGTVGSLRQKREAKKAAQRVYGPFGISALVRSAQTKNLSSDAQSKLAAA
jgi:osmotically-inducible protein OsmY